MSKPKRSDSNRLEAAREALASVRARKQAVLAQLEEARQAQASYTSTLPPVVRVRLRQAERDMAAVELEEFDAIEAMKAALFASEVASNDPDTALVFGLFDKLTEAGDKVAALQAEIARVYSEAETTFTGAMEAHSRLNQRRASAGDPLAASPCASGLALVNFLAHVPPAKRSAVTLREAMRISTDVEALEGATLEEKARALITGPARQRNPHRLQAAERELFEAQRVAMVTEQREADQREIAAQYKRAREAEIQDDARRSAERFQEEARRQAALAAEQEAVRSWAEKRAVSQ